MAVHRELGCGFLEAIYQEALALEFTERDIPFVRELQLSLAYKGKPLKTRYSPDFICYGSVVVELRALNRIGRIEQVQVINYLKATGAPVGLLFNFGRRKLEYRRVFPGKDMKPVQRIGRDSVIKP